MACPEDIVQKKKWRFNRMNCEFDFDEYQGNVFGARR